MEYISTMKKEWTTDTQNINDSQHYAKWKKADTQIYMPFHLGIAFLEKSRADWLAGAPGREQTTKG